ncbi:MAG TPA: bifunctional class I SAM-dependent methyltransferase/glycosyltransferase family 2 protein [Bryobacteraceae bacterium]|jgi:SAM-dependent methyltransferase
MERTRERYWRSHPQSSPIKLRWRALTVRHCFHVLPGESILEIGAGGGLWTSELARVFRGENAITAAAFNSDLIKASEWNGLENVHPVLVETLDDLPAGAYDYVIGTAILCHDRYPETLKAIYRLLKPGGQILFFENNLWNPQVLIKTVIPLVGRWTGNARCQIGMSKYRFLRIASHQGFTNVDVIPYDIIHPLLPRRIIPTVQSIAFVFEHAPVIKDLCGSLYLWARKPGGSQQRPAINLARHSQFRRAVSFVVPCYNEEMNVGPLVSALIKHFDDYIHEILIVDDNSTDKTSAVTQAIAEQEPRVRLIRRKPPNGVGRGLRDGYAAATGAYILTMDCDFVQIVPELRDLFDAVAEGYDGAIGSRFTHDSIMVNYPFPKILANRLFHLLARTVLRLPFHDISNNLKLYRAEVLKNIHIDQHHFAANAETGLKPLVAGYRVKEVAVSWINRTLEMGPSSFRILRVGPNYVLALWDVLRKTKRMKSELRVNEAHELT